MAKPKIEFFFDFNSTYSYLANARIASFAAECRADVAYRPMSVLTVMKAAGNAPTPTCPAKFSYNWGDAQRWASDYGVTLIDNPHLRSIDTRPLCRMALGADARPDIGPVRDVFFMGFWGMGLNMGDATVVQDLLEKQGIDAEEVLAFSDHPELEASLRANSEEAVKRGAFGAPTLFVGDSMFFGNDRFDFVKRALNAV